MLLQPVFTQREFAGAMPLAWEMLLRIFKEVSHMGIELNIKEKELLLRILHSRNETLREEIRHTDTPHYKDSLRKERLLLQSLLARVEQAITTPERTAAA
jgi:hypothetical protein